ncbi:MAG: hypothetical protein COA57_10480 [Flavobacteriales bacterium]|nr:MAG: hypothetical protein COA57_10480 [Flavobacteriales bacterium]
MKTKLFIITLFTTANAFAQVPNLTTVNSWAYQLQNMSVSQIAADTSFELIVMDYSLNGDDASKFTTQEISQIKNSGKKAIAYLSIGEAENYRFYWDTAWNTFNPAFLGPENPDWPGNYKVKFWDSQWQDIVFQYIDTIMAQGFDGIYMDIIDAWYYWQTENPQEPMADSLMVEFMQNIRNHVDFGPLAWYFYLIPQNGEDVFDGDNSSASLKSKWFTAIDGIGVEDVFFPGNLDEDNAYNPDNYRLSILQDYVQNSKQVFSVEYLTQSSKISQFISEANNQSFVPYVCTRDLDQLCSGITGTYNLQLTNDDMEIWPNPSKGIFQLKIENKEFGMKYFEVKIYNILGEELLSYILQTTSHELKFDLSNLHKGVYFLQLGQAVRKLVIQ